MYVCTYDMHGVEGWVAERGVLTGPVKSGIMSNAW